MDPKHYCYEIRIEQPLSESCQTWFNDVEILQAGGETLLRCSPPDQTALFGVLARVRDLNLTLVSVTRVELPEPYNWD